MINCSQSADLFEHGRNKETPKADLQEVTGQKAESEIMLFKGIDNSEGNGSLFSIITHARSGVSQAVCLPFSLFFFLFGVSFGHANLCMHIASTQRHGCFMTHSEREIKVTFAQSPVIDLLSPIATTSQSYMFNIFHLLGKCFEAGQLKCN